VAHNRGLREAHGSSIAITDDDVLVDRYWLAELVQGFATPDVACVTGLILPAELETPAQLWLESYVRLNKGFERQVFDLAENRVRSPLYPYAAGFFGSGANMAFRASALRELGGFDAEIGAGTYARGGDDLAAFVRVVTAGHTLVYEPRAILWHKYRRELDGLKRQMFDYGVGLTAYLTKTVVDNPSIVLHFALRIPHGIAHILSPRSPKNDVVRPPFARELIRAERKGMLFGPAAYMISRRRSRRPAAHGSRPAGAAARSSGGHV